MFMLLKNRLIFSLLLVGLTKLENEGLEVSLKLLVSDFSLHFLPLSYVKSTCVKKVSNIVNRI